MKSVVTEEQKNQSRETDFQLQLQGKEETTGGSEKTDRGNETQGGSGIHAIAGRSTGTRAGKITDRLLFRLIWWNPLPKESGAQIAP